MRIPSRRMPLAPEPSVIPSRIVAGCLIMALTTFGVLSWFNPPLLMAAVLLGSIGVATALISKAGQQRIDRMASERRGESICTFARALDYRTIDTWIIRATHEELRKAWPDLPIRPTDRLRRRPAPRRGGVGRTRRHRGAPLGAANRRDR